MKLHLNTNDHRFIIKGYGEGFVTINGERHEKSLILTPERMLDWSVTNADMLDDAQLTSLLQDDPEVIIIGTGPNQIAPNPAVMRFFARHGLGLEFVSTPSACRVYNILASEGRRVSCGLIV